MSQYRPGGLGGPAAAAAATVTNGDATVTFTGTTLTSDVAAGDLLWVSADTSVYFVASVTNDTSLELTTTYSGTTRTETTWAITRDFTPNAELPLITRGDIETGTLYNRSMQILDAGGGGGGGGASTLNSLLDVDTIGVANGEFLGFDADTGLWVPATPPGGGDMLASVYDPTGIEDSAFSMGNMIETTAAKILTEAERTKLTRTAPTTGDFTFMTADAANSFDIGALSTLALSTGSGWTAEFTHTFTGTVQARQLLLIENNSGFRQNFAGTPIDGSPLALENGYAALLTRIASTAKLRPIMYAWRSSGHPLQSLTPARLIGLESGTVQGPPKALTAAQIWPWFFPIDDNQALVRDPADTTKRVRIDAGSVGTGQTRTITMPNSDVTLVRTNLAGTTPPSTSADSTQGYAVGSSWFDTTNDHIYMCIDAFAGNAVWLQVDGTSDGGTGTAADTYDLVVDSTNYTVAAPFDVGTDGALKNQYRRLTNTTGTQIINFPAGIADDSYGFIQLGTGVSAEIRCPSSVTVNALADRGGANAAIVVGALGEFKWQQIGVNTIAVDGDLVLAKTVYGPHTFPQSVTFSGGVTGGVVFNGQTVHVGGARSQEDIVAGTYTIILADLGKIKRYTGAGHTWTINTVSGVGEVAVENDGSGAIALTAGTATLAGSTSIPAGKSATIRFYNAGAKAKALVQA